MSQFQIIFLVLLAVLWAILLFGGFIFGKTNPERTRRMPRWTRLASSFTLVISAFLWYVYSRSTAYESIALFFAIGMLLGFIGDLFMAQVFPIKDYIIGGMASFGLGHIVYIMGMFQTGRAINWGIVALWWLIAAIAWYVVVFRGSEKKLLHYLALPYSLLLASTAGFATSLAVSDTAYVLVAIGAALFLLSDLILAGELFRDLRFPYVSDWVWLTYGPGQMLIVLGLFFYSMATSI